MSERSKAVVGRLVEEVWSQGNLDILDKIIHPDANPPHGPWDLPGGPEGFKHLVSIIRIAFPDLRATIGKQVVDGDNVVTHLTLSGTHEGDYRGGFFRPIGR